MNNFTVTLSDTELKALEYVAYDANDWIQNAVRERCRIAFEELVQATIVDKLAKGEAVSGNKDEIALSSSLLSAKSRHDAFIAEQLPTSQA